MNHRDSATKISQSAAKLAIAAVITYQLMLFGLIFIRPDMDPSWRALSEYALGPRGWMMSAAFLVGALSYGSLWMALRFQSSGVWGKIGLGILLLCAIGTTATGIFTTDLFDTTVLSTRGTIHMISAFAALTLLPFAALLINLNLALRNPAWSSARRPLLWTAGLPLLGLVAFWVHLAIYVIPLGGHAHGPGVPLGWPPRLLFLVYMAWLVTVAYQALVVHHRRMDAAPNP